MYPPPDRDYLECKTAEASTNFAFQDENFDSFPSPRTDVAVTGNHLATHITLDDAFHFRPELLPQHLAHLLHQISTAVVLNEVALLFGERPFHSNNHHIVDDESTNRLRSSAHNFRLKPQNSLIDCPFNRTQFSTTVTDGLFPPSARFLLSPDFNQPTPVKIPRKAYRLRDLTIGSSHRPFVPSPWDWNRKRLFNTYGAEISVPTCYAYEVS